VPSHLLCLIILLLTSATGCGGSSGVMFSSFDDTSPSEDPLPAIAPEKPLSIMAVGDSITHGALYPEPSASWRLPFTRQLNTSGCRHEMTGSQLTNAFHTAFESPHESYSSQEANHFVTGFKNGAGINEGIFNTMATYSPAVVLLHIGTNDAIQSQDNRETINEIDHIVTTVLNAGGDVLVANVIPSYTYGYLDGVDQRIEELGNLIEAYVTQLANSRVNLVDVRDGYTEDLMFDDGLHPNDEGSTHIASAFFKEFTANGYCI